jgi:hypothetical protein
MRNSSKAQIIEACQPESWDYEPLSNVVPYGTLRRDRLEDQARRFFRQGDLGQGWLLIAKAQLSDGRDFRVVA